MKTPNGNKGALPVSTTDKFNPGFTKREHIAIEAMKSLIHSDMNSDEVIYMSIELADKLLDALDQ
jgi:hypothetical protein